MRAQLPARWAAGRFPDPQARAAWLAGNDLLDLPESFTDFETFYDHRHALMRARLAEVLSAAPGIPDPGTTPAVDTVAAHSPTVDVVPEPEDRRPASGTGHPHPRGRTRAAFEEKLPDLIADGRLRIGEVLHAEYGGRHQEATVERGGLRVDGRVFDDPSPAGRVVTDGISVNGWKLWTTSDGRRLRELRRR